jgi:hypothetical protein
VRHGTRSTYINHGCHCDRCTAANREYVAANRENHAAAAVRRAAQNGAMDENVTLNIEVVAHGPLDGRHIIVLPDDTDAETFDAVTDAIVQHFADAWQATHPGESIDAAAVVPMVMFGEHIRIEGAPE